MKLTQKAKLLTKFCLLLQPYSIRRERWRIYFPITKYPYGFLDYLFHLFLTIFFAINHHSRQYLAATVVINHDRTRRLTKILAAISFSFCKMWGYPGYLIS